MHSHICYRQDARWPWTSRPLVSHSRESRFFPRRETRKHFPPSNRGIWQTILSLTNTRASLEKILTSVSSKKKRRAGRLLNELIAWSGVAWLAAKTAAKDMTRALQNVAAPARRRLVIVGGIGTNPPHCDCPNPLRLRGVTFSAQPQTRIGLMHHAY